MSDTELSALIGGVVGSLVGLGAHWFRRAPVPAPAAMTIPASAPAPAAALPIVEPAPLASPLASQPPLPPPLPPDLIVLPGGARLHPFADGSQVLEYFDGTVLVTDAAGRLQTATGLFVRRGRGGARA